MYFSNVKHNINSMFGLCAILLKVFYFGIVSNSTSLFQEQTIPADSASHKQIFILPAKHLWGGWHCCCYLFIYFVLSVCISYPSLADANQEVCEKSVVSLPPHHSTPLSNLSLLSWYMNWRIFCPISCYSLHLRVGRKYRG